MPKLISISNKELKSEMLDSNDLKFINSMIGDAMGCVKTLGGWYPSLYYGYLDFQLNGKNVWESTSDITFADVHTQPTDDSGNLIGFSLQCGTGYPNLAVIAHNNTLYTGFVYSYFEDTSKDFKFYDDIEWKSKVDAKQLQQPKFTHLYQANSKGGYAGEQTSLWTYKEISDIATIDAIETLSPNPASDYIEISVAAHHDVSNQLAIFDILGIEQSTPNLTPTLSEGEGVVRLDISHLSPGVYFVRVGDVVRKFVKM